MSRQRFARLPLALLCLVVGAACGDDSGSNSGDPIDGGNSSDGAVTPASCTAICTENEFCDFDPDSCGYGSEQGTCVPRPEGCGAVYEPVCGCDGQTYSNACEAHADGIDVLFEGTCQKETCSTEDPCILCAVGDMPEAEEDCYCLGCPSIPMPQSECMTKTIAYNKVCSGLLKSCPEYLCLEPPPVSCDGAGACVIGNPRI